MLGTRRTLKMLMMTAAVWGIFSATSFALDGMMVKANIPFSFVAGAETFPAGNYVFRVDDPMEPAALFITTQDGKEHEFLLTEAQKLPHETPARDSKLVFDRYGDGHYLSEIWVAGLDEGRAIPMSEIQRERVSKLEHERMFIPLHK